MMLASVYALLDRQEEAEATINKLREISPQISVESVSKGWPYKNQADLEFILDALRKAGLPE
jgi:hypothetical protein